MKVLALLFALLCPFAAHAQPAIDWQDSYADVRYGVADGIVWAFWYGFDGDGNLYIRRRLIDPAKLGREAVEAAQSWAAGANHGLPRSPASAEVWNDPRTDIAHDAMLDAIAIERETGKRPAWKPWRVLPNSDSTTTPPTRPMWAPDGTKQVKERAVVGDVCDCRNKIVKGKQTLCPLRSEVARPATGNIAACAPGP